MKFLKTLFLAAVVLSTAAPVFADEGNMVNNEGITAAAPSDDGGMNIDARRRRPRPRMHVCYARNAIGRTFAARSWNVRVARNQAIRTCRARSFGPLGFSCRSAGCR